MADLQTKLDSQAVSTGATGNSANGNGLRMRVLQIPGKVNGWTTLLPNNPLRKFLVVRMRPGDNGPVSAEMAFDSQSRGDTFNIDQGITFDGGFAPTNAVNVYLTSQYGDTTANIQVIEG